MVKLCGDVGELKKALEGLPLNQGINGVVVITEVTKQKGIKTMRVEIKTEEEFYS